MNQIAPATAAENNTVGATAEAPRTSLTHPINVSWIFPPDVLAFDALSQFITPDADLFDYLTQPVDFAAKLERSGPALGNIGLSSCPGKKVRLDTGPVRGKAVVRREVADDFYRLASLSFKKIVCLLNDEELQYLGAPWSEYYDAAMRHGMTVMRYPIAEGFSPTSIETFHELVVEIEKTVKVGDNVLIHCRGGVGRAGLVACCVLLKLGVVSTAERAILVARRRRSPKAVETRDQEVFIENYAEYIRK